uniref:DDE Tnp4 domain-containing protein n=1 Tax=Brassica oleracea var. oleracea TaxID=109376 RepID=A0A0D3CCD3_BRAOL
MDPSEFDFDIEAYKRQSEIEERYILNHFRERRQKIEQDYPSSTREDTSREIMQLQIKGWLTTTFPINLHMTMQCIVDDSGCENMFSSGLLGIYQAVTTTSPSDLTQLIKKPTRWMNTSKLEVLQLWSACVDSRGKDNLLGEIREPPLLFLKQLHPMIYGSGMLFFGCPGTLNDINVLDRSSVFDDVEQGNTPRVNFFVNQRPYNMAYYLADGIYPSYPTFIKLIRLPQSEPNKLFAQVQEGCRKDIEHAFGVLHARFKIIREPARMWDISDLAIIMRSCIILHNMIVEDERDTYAQHWTDYDQSEASGSNAPQPFSTEVLPAFANHVRARSELELRDSNVHHELQADLVKHI